MLPRLEILVSNLYESPVHCVQNNRTKSLQLINTPHIFLVPLSSYFPFFANIYVTDVYLSLCFGFCISLILERLLGNFSALFFSFKEKGKHFFFKNSIHLFERLIPTRTCFKWTLSFAPGTLHGKTPSFVLPISSSHFSSPIW